MKMDRKEFGARLAHIVEQYEAHRCEVNQQHFQKLLALYGVRLVL
jgi:hypothetical protein